jgi:biopolymer transport protein ExbD
MPEVKEGGVNVTPLIDVVMCLIIFFMLVAKIGVATGALPMDLPQTIMGKKIEALGDSVILNIVDPNPPVEAEGGGVQHDGAGHIIHQKKFELPVVYALLSETDTKTSEMHIRTEGGQREFYNELKRVVEARKKVGKADAFAVTIRADKDLQFSMLQAVLADIAEAGIRNVNFGAKSKTTQSGGASK